MHLILLRALFRPKSAIHYSISTKALHIHNTQFTFSLHLYTAKPSYNHWIDKKYNLLKQ